jgi:glycosyltransferase involved in cell wall biosynthesis
MTAAMPREPRVVAMVPAWNAAEFIQRTLDALSAQTYRNLEILVSVDLSSDGTADICEAHSRTDSRVRVIRHRTRQGFVGNTRALLQAADGKYLSWAWHDDILLPEYVSTLVPLLEMNPRTVCAFTDLELHHLDGRVSTLSYTSLQNIEDPMERAKRVLWIPENWWLPNRGVFRSDAARRVGGFKRNWAGEYKSDWPWALHMAILGEHVRVPGVMCRKFIKITSLSASWRRNHWTNLAAALACGREIRGSDLPFSRKLRLHATLAVVIKAFLQQRYPERPEFRRVSAYHRAARDAERRLRGDGGGTS